MSNSKYTELPTTSRHLPEHCPTIHTPNTTENGPELAETRLGDPGDRGKGVCKKRDINVVLRDTKVNEEESVQKKLKMWTQRLHRRYKSMFVGSITDAEVAAMIRAYGKPLKVFRSHRKYQTFIILMVLMLEKVYSVIYN